MPNITSCFWLPFVAPVLVHALLPVLLGGVDDAATEANHLTLTDLHVWTGTTFEERDLFVRDGVFVEAPAASGAEARILSLGGAWVVPPLADAHTHRFSTAYDAQASRRMFLERGILYVANLCSPRDARSACAEQLRSADGVDALFTFGALTGPGGHPIALYRRLHEDVYRRPAETFWEENADNTFYVVDSLEDLERAWQALLALDPDWVKVILSESEHHEAHRADPATEGWRGFDPALLAEVTLRAHAAGRRVVVHVDTRADFVAAVEAGVDLLAHTPGYGLRDRADWDRHALTAEDARAARAAGVVQITTACVARTELGREVVAANLRLLRDHDVPLVIGSDAWDEVSECERRALVATGVVSPGELLELWCHATPRARFPGRRIGRLAPGYEGSLVVLGGNPLDDPERLGDVLLVVKHGRIVFEAPALVAPSKETREATGGATGQGR